MSIKAIKPLRLSLLYRPYQWHGANHLAVTAVALVDFSGPRPLLVSDMELWRQCIPEMDCEGLLDLVLPKQVPEYLVAAQAYTTHQDQKNQVMVKAKVGELEKSLVVFGQRHWVDERTFSVPQAFECMPLHWAHTYGGVNFANNPQGKGIDTDPYTGQVLLPNVEGLTDRVQQRRDQGKPASFGPIPMLWPQRYQYIGSYTDHWRQYESPGFFADMSPLFFNAAAEDQRWSQRDEVPLGADFAFWHMHPTKACWQGRLPEWRIRCFMQQKIAEKWQDKEMPLRATTVWFIPHQERAVLLFHGSVPVAEHDASDVKTLMVGLEESETFVHSAEHYFAIMHKRLDPKLGGLYVEADEQLIPPALMAPLDLGIEAVQQSATWIKSQNLQNQRLMDHKAFFEEIGEDPEWYRIEQMGPPPPDDPIYQSDEDFFSTSVAEHFEQEKAEVDKNHEKILRASGLSAEQQAYFLQKKPTSVLSEAPDGEDTASPHRGPPAPLKEELRELQLLQQVLGKDGQVNGEALTELAPDLASSFSRLDIPKKVAVPKSSGLSTLLEREQESAPMGAEAFEQMERLEELRKQMYLLSAQSQSPVDTLSDPENEQAKKRFLQKIAQQEGIAHVDFSGMRLSGLSLTEADCSQAWLEGTDLSHAHFSHCVFDEAVLTRANLSHARFEHCRFIKTNLAQGQCEQAYFVECTFENVELEGIQLAQSYFMDCDFQQLFIEELDFSSCVIQGGTMQSVMCDRSQFQHSKWLNVQFKKVTWQQCEFLDFMFEGCEFDSCGFFMNRIEALIFSACAMNNSALHYQNQVQQFAMLACDAYQCFFREMNFAQADFSLSRLEMCDFTHCDLSEAVFYRCDAHKANFTHAHLHQANFHQASLIEACFKAADMRFANFKEANLFRVDASLAHLDDSTVLHGAYSKEINIYPQRQEYQHE